MKLESAGAVVTGASRGIGVTLAEALAARGVRLVLAARSAASLEEVRERLAKIGAKVAIVPTDVSDSRALEELVARAAEELGAIDLLVNNAGIEHTSHFEHETLEDIERMLRVNLFGPMALTRLVLPDMIARDRGHVLCVSSLAGLGPAAFSEAYCASKHGLVGFTRSLRASLQARGSRVSASVVCPGYVRDAGMFADTSREHGVTAPASAGTSSPADVARAAIRAIERDVPEVVVSPRPIRPLLALGAVWPRLVERIVNALRANEAFRTVADRRLAARSEIGSDLSSERSRR